MIADRFSPNNEIYIGQLYLSGSGSPIPSKGFL